MACKEHLINSPTGPPLPHLSDGFPHSAGVTPRPHWRATAAALGACPEAGLGVASEGPKPGDGGLSHQEPLLLSSKRAGFRLLQTGSRGHGQALLISCSWKEPSLGCGPQACLEEGCGLGWRLQGREGQVSEA